MTQENNAFFITIHSHCTFNCYFIERVQNGWCFITKSRVCNEMMKSIYQSNCRLGARTIVTKA